MPIYEFVCEACGNEYEKIVSFSAEGNPPCPVCMSEHVRRRVGMPAIHFKGSGWYITDSKKNGSGKKSENNGSGEKSTNDGSAESNAESSDGKSTDKNSSKESSSDTAPSSGSASDGTGSKKESGDG